LVKKVITLIIPQCWNNQEMNQWASKYNRKEKIGCKIKKTNRQPDIPDGQLYPAFQEGCSSQKEVEDVQKGFRVQAYNVA